MRKKRKKSREMSLLTALLVLLCVLTACGSAVDLQTEQKVGGTGTFTDSCGREVEVPEKITRVAATGSMAQIFLFALCPDELVGISEAWDETQLEYIDEKYHDLPVIGQLHGGSGQLNPETLLGTDAQIIIDVGEGKDSIGAEMNDITQLTGIPAVHIEASVDRQGDAYRLLGQLLGKEKEAETLASYCDQVYDEMKMLSETVEKKRVLYITGEEGLNVIAKDSYHGQIMDMMADNLAVVTEPSSKGSGNQVDMEQILLWNPEYMIFSPESIYDSVGEDPQWQTITAIRNGNYYRVPEGPYNWLGFPPSVQRVLGMQWLAKTLYPEAADYDMKERTIEFYRMFFHVDLTEKQYKKLGLTDLNVNTKGN